LGHRQCEKQKFAMNQLVLLVLALVALVLLLTLLLLVHGIGFLK